jgi:pyochelin biosynthetic protein PchC
MNSTTRFSGWFRRMKSAERASVRLVCFPHGGGAASFFRPWVPYLPRGVDLVALQYPGREVRIAEPPMTDLRAMAEEIADALGVLSDVPLVFFGHSLGASLAFETALRHQLSADPAPLLQLIVSGRPAPRHVRRQAKYLLDDDALCAELRRLGGTPDPLCDSREVRATFLPALRADLRAADGYYPDPWARVRCPLLAFTGDADVEVPVQHAADWRELTTSRFELSVFGGDHFYLARRVAEVVGKVVRGLGFGPCTESTWPSTP